MRRSPGTTTIAAVLITAVLVTSPSAAEEPAAGVACKERYNQPAKFLANPDESVLIAGVIGWCRKNKRRLLWDERYAATARLWSAQLLEGGVSRDRMLPVDRLRFDLRSRGVVDARVEPFSADGAVETVPDGMLPFLDREAVRGRFTHFGVGVARTPDQKRMVTTLLLGRRPALLDPLPMCPKPSDRLDLRVRLHRGYRHPSWLMTVPGGQVLRDALLYEEGIWSAEVPLDAGRGTYRLELTVHGPQGPEVAALFPLYVGVPRPRVPTVKVRPAPGRYRTPEDAEKAVVAMINKDRERQSLPALVVEERLSDVAREHAMDLLTRRHAVHRTASSGALVDRLRASGIPFSRALENVSLSPSPEQAHERFMESPGHRINVVDPHVTHLGVGIAMERGAQEDILAVCEVLVEKVEATDVSAVAQRLLSLVNAKRQRKGRFALGMDKDLSRMALRSVRRLTAMGDKADPQREGDAMVRELSEGTLEIPDVRVRYYRTSNLRRVIMAPDVLAEDINRLGIGVARTSDRRRPDEMWIAVIFAGR